MVDEIKEKINNALQIHQSGNLELAESLYKEILAEDSENASVLNLLGLLNLQLKKYDEAVSSIKKAVELNPCAYFYENLARVYSEQKKYEDAITYHKKALEFGEQAFDIWFSLGLDYKNSKQIDEAIEAYKNALLIQPSNPAAFFNLANIYEGKNETFKALECYENAYKFNKRKTDTDIPYFLGITYLKTKNFKKGLEFHESRPSKKFATFCQQREYPQQFEGKEMWNGQPMQDKTLFVFYESALGDTLMYVRYLALVKDMFKKVLFKPQMCFEQFFRENNFGAEIIDYKTLPENLIFDTYIPLMSIPYVLNLNTEEIPLSEGYLKANQEKTAEYKEKYFNNNKFKIGIKWKGNTAYELNRIIQLDAFYKLFELPNTQFYSVQKGEGIEELENVPDKYNIISLGETFNDFNDTAAALANLDLVICNDTSVAHLAGALGKPCWIMLPYVQNWRWHTDISYSPWYKSVKLFKQNEPGNWHEVFDRAYEELKSKIL